MMRRKNLAQARRGRLLTGVLRRPSKSWDEIVLWQRLGLSAGFGATSWLAKNVVEQLHPIMDDLIKYITSHPDVLYHSSSHNVALFTLEPDRFR